MKNNKLKNRGQTSIEYALCVFVLLFLAMVFNIFTKKEVASTNRNTMQYMFHNIEYVVSGPYP